MAAISCCELRSVRAALLRLGELNLPALQSSEIPDYYLNVSPYLCFTQKCQIQLWMEHPGKGVALCPCVLWALPAEGPGEWYQCQVHPQHLWIPTLYLKVPGTPSFIAANLLLGVSDQAGFVIAGVTTAQSLSKGLILTCVPWLGSSPLLPAFSSFSWCTLTAASPGVLCTRISPQKYHLIALLG